MTTEQLVPPNVYLTSVSCGQLTFNWTFTSQDCPTLYHKINNNRCGECPYNTTSNSIVCRIHNVSTSPQLCLLSVESVVCDSLRGVVSEPILLLVQGCLNKVYTCNNSAFNLCRLQVFKILLAQSFQST